MGIRAAPRENPHGPAAAFGLGIEFRFIRHPHSMRRTGLKFQPGPTTHPGTMNLGTLCADTVLSSFTFPAGTGYPPPALHLSRRRFLLLAAESGRRSCAILRLGAGRPVSDLDSAGARSDYPAALEAPVTTPRSSGPTCLEANRPASVNRRAYYR